jgi:hypothetical protein
MAAGRSRRAGLPLPHPKHIHVYFVDPDAMDTDSSGDEDERGKRCVREVIDINVLAVKAVPLVARRLVLPSHMVLVRHPAAKAAGSDVGSAALQPTHHLQLPSQQEVDPPLIYEGQHSLFEAHRPPYGLLLLKLD